MSSDGLETKSKNLLPARYPKATPTNPEATVGVAFGFASGKKEH